MLAFSLISAAKAEAPRTIESAFESITTKLTVKPDAVNVPVEWKYTNHWDFPLYVEKFDESCGCLSGQAKVEKIAPVEPGKSGVITANFTAGAHRGILRKSIHVRFVGHDKPVELVVEATIPSSVELSSKELDWKIGEEVKTQTVDVTTGTEADFKITALQGLPESLFKTTQATVVPLRHYRIQITPLSASAPDIQCLQIHTDSKDTRDQIVPVFLKISRPATTAKTENPKP